MLCVRALCVPLIFIIFTHTVGFLDSYFLSYAWRTDCKLGIVSHITEQRYNEERRFVLPCTVAYKAFPQLTLKTDWPLPLAYTLTGETLYLHNLEEE